MRTDREAEVRVTFLWSFCVEHVVAESMLLHSLKPHGVAESEGRRNFTTKSFLHKATYRSCCSAVEYHSFCPGKFDISNAKIFLKVPIIQEPNQTKTKKAPKRNIDKDVVKRLVGI